MAEIGSLAVSLSLDASKFNGSIAQVDRNLRSMGGELQALKNKGLDYGKSIDGLASKKEVLGRAVSAASLKLEEQKKRYDELIASGKATDAQIERQAIAVNRAQAEYNRLEKELSDVTAALKVQSSQWTIQGKNLEDAGKKLKNIGEGMQNVGKKLSIGVTAPIMAAGAGALKSAIDFETAFAGVRKTVDTTEAGFAKLEKGIREMSKQLPASASDIAAVGEAAGQLGIAEENILSFTRTIIDLGEATNLSTEQGASEFARFANIVGMSQGNFDRLGSSIVALGNTMATTESEIMSMAMRLAAQGSQVGMTEAQILALSATMSSLGIEAEAGGTAMTTVLKKMQNAVSAGGNDLKAFAKAAKTSTNEFAKAFKEDAANALDLVIKGLAQSTVEGANLNDILDDMGIKGIREADTMLRLAGAADLLSGAVNTSSSAWQENTALADEAAQRYATTESQMAMLKNQIVDIGISFGQTLIPMARDAMDKIGGMVEKFSDLDEQTKKNIIIIGGLVAAAGPLLMIGGTIMAGIGGLVTTVGALSTAIGSAGGLTAVTVKLGSKLAFLTPGVGLAALGIAALGTATIFAVKELQKSSIEIEDWTDKVSESTAKAVGSFVELSDEASAQLTTLSITGQAITIDMATNITGTFAQMSQQILSEMEARHTEQLNAITTFYANSNILIEEEENEILAKTAQYQENKEKQISEGNARIAEIMSLASEEKRALTLAEEAEISHIHSKMKENAIKYMTESEMEQKVILEAMKNNASEKTALQAAEVVKNSIDQKNKVISEAEEQYKKAVALIIHQRDEMGVISGQQAKQLIEDAGRQRDETIKAAEEMHTNIVDEAKKQAEEHVNQVDWETGEVMSKWEVMKTNVSQKMKETGAAIKKDWSQAWDDTKESVDNIKKAVSDKFDEMKQSIDNKMLEAKTKITDKWNEAEEFLRSIDLKEIGKDIIGGLVVGITGKIGDVVTATQNIGQTVITTISNVLQRRSPARKLIEVGHDIGDGLVIGINDKRTSVSNAMKEIGQIIVDSAKANAEYTKEANEIVYRANYKSQQDIISLESELAKEKIKIQNDANAKIAKLNATENAKKVKNYQKLALDIQTVQNKADSDMQKAIQNTNAKIVKLESQMQSNSLKELKAYHQAKKQSGEMSLADEAAYWQKSLSYYKDGTKEHTDILKMLNKATDELNKERLEAIKNYIAEKKSLDQLSLKDEVLIWEQYLNAFEDGSKQRLDAQKSYQKALEALNNEILTINANYQSQMQKINDDLLNKEKELNNAYQNEFARRVKLYTDFAGTFDKFVVEYNITGQQLIDNLTSQVVALNQFEALFDNLSQRGISADLLKEISEMGVKALPQLQALVNMTDEQLTSYSAIYDEKSRKAREMATNELEGMKSDTEQQIIELRAIADEQLNALNVEWKAQIKKITQVTSKELAGLEQIGMNAGQGLLNGLASMEGPLITKATEIANSIRSAIQSALNIEGMNSMIAQAEKSSIDLANAVSSSQTSYDYSKSFAPVINNYGSSSNVNEQERLLRRLAFEF